MSFHAITHVWGRDYLNLFLIVCVPNQLAPGNVPALPPGSRYRILTRTLHVDEIASHPSVQALRKVIPVDIVALEELDQAGGGADNDCSPMIACHRRAIHDAIEAKAAVLFLSADFVFSQNAFAAVVQRHREGYRAVVTTGLRLAKRPFLEALEGLPLAALSSRELVRIALPHLHHHERDMFRDARPSNQEPVAVYWPVGDVGLLARCFHLHPLMVDPVVRKELEGTVDGRYLSDVCPDFSRVHVVTDSDELQMFELTPANRRMLSRTADRLSVHEAVKRASRCDALQLRHWQRSAIRIHAGDLDGRWRAVKADSDAFVAAVMREKLMARIRRAYRKHVQGYHAQRRWARIQKRIVREMRLTWNRAYKAARLRAWRG